MKLLSEFIEKRVAKQVSPIGLSIFRIAYGLVFFFEVLFIYRYKELFFDPIPFIEPSPMQFGLPLLLWLITILCIIFGYYTRYAAIVNYVFTLVFISTLTTFEYHMHYTYIGINFLLMFLPLSKTISLDRYFKREVAVTVSSIYYLLPVFIGIALVYFDSTFFKISSQMWLRGSGVWLPASVPQVTILDNQWFLNQKWLMVFLGYLTLLFEFIFIFTFFRKRFRVPLLIIGLGLHIGIFFTFPIPLFALGYMAIYLLMVPIYCWQSMFKKLNKSVVEVTFTAVELTKLTRTIKITLLLVAVLVLNVTLHFSPALKSFTNRVYTKIGVQNIMRPLIRGVEDFSSKMFGIGPHGVFVDSHFVGYDNIVAVSYQSDQGEIWLPFIEKDGSPGGYISGSNWAYLSFRVNGPNQTKKNLYPGIIRLVSFWANKNDVNLETTTFILHSKKISFPLNYKWQKDFLQQQRDMPWEKIGELSWSDATSTLVVLTTESDDDNEI